MFKASSALFFFLLMPNSESWQNAVKTEEKKKWVGTNLYELINEDGKVPIKSTEEATNFCATQQAFVDQHRECFNELILCGKDVNQKSKDMAQTVANLGRALSALSEL